MKSGTPVMLVGRNYIPSYREGIWIVVRPTLKSYIIRRTRSDRRSSVGTT